MSFKVIPTDRFKKDAKRLIKKYPSLKQELVDLNNILCTTPDSGTPLGMTHLKFDLL
jgi:mRNA-degrading endonuclease RelE of RelBE toxin-antitoxin system